MEISAPKIWDEALGLLERIKGVAIILGGIDTGKTTFARFLINQLTLKKRRPALVDADIGQSSLGPPTTIGLRLFDSPPDWEADLAPELFFVGSTSPEGNFELHLKGTKSMVNKALSYGAEGVLVDTTGLISADFGKLLKRRKIELTSPRLLFGLQRSSEIEPILTLFEDNPQFKILRIPASASVRSRSAEERKAYRERKYESYFKGSLLRAFSLPRMTLEGRVIGSDGVSIPPERSVFVEGLLIGLITSAGDTAALGIIRHFDEGESRMSVLTPLKNMRTVKGLRLSSLKLTQDFEEERLLNEVT